MIYVTQKEYDEAFQYAQKLGKTSGISMSMLSRYNRHVVAFDSALPDKQKPIRSLTFAHHPSGVRCLDTYTIVPPVPEYDQWRDADALISRMEDIRQSNSLTNDDVTGH